MYFNPWFRRNKLSKIIVTRSSEIVSVESKQFIPLADFRRNHTNCLPGWSVAVEIPLNRGHICSVLSKGILNGLRAKENDANYAVGRLSSSCGVNRTLRT